MLNVVCIQGNLTRDPEFKQLNEKTCVCEFAIASNKHIGKNEDGSKREITSFVDIKTWGRLAEVCAANLEKGRQVLIQGELQQQRWTQEDGKQRSRIIVNANEVTFIGGRRHGEEKRQDPPRTGEEPEV